jgi:hypothetical protein
MARAKRMRRNLIAAGLLAGGLALAACGSAGPGVQARQTGDTTTTTTPETTTTTSAPATSAPGTTAPPATAATVPALPCTNEALGAAFTAAKYGSLAGLKVQQCVSGWATSAESHGYGPPTFTLYRAEGDHWVAVNHSAAKLCEGQGVPAEVAPAIGCDR